VEPAHPPLKYGLPIEIARFELGSGFVAAVIKHHRWAHAVAAIAVDGCHIRAIHPVVFKTAVKRHHAHRPNAFRNQVTNRVIDHGCSNACAQPEAISQVGSTVKLTAADVNLAAARLAKGNHTWVEPVHQGTQ